MNAYGLHWMCFSTYLRRLVNFLAFGYLVLVACPATISALHPRAFAYELIIYWNIWKIKAQFYSVLFDLRPLYFDTILVA